MKIDEILKTRRIIVTCGTGGVGKTTLSAAIALRAAILGRKTVVITIDPAKRLATSLGLKELGDQPTDLSPQIEKALSKIKASSEAPGGLTEMKGKLSAIMPDTRKTFENFVRGLTEDEEKVDRILKNPIFHIFAEEFSGANEYMALERLSMLEKSGEFDCIILDTPPSRNTLAFLEAPKTLAAFFEERMIRWLVMPANRLVSGGMKKALSILEKLTGAGFMTHLVDFAASLFDVQARFTSNLKRITQLLESKEVGFVMVTVPSPDTAPEALHFIQMLREHRLNFDGIALNRTLGYLKRAHPELKHPGLDIFDALQRRESAVIQQLLNQNPSLPLCAMLPELARDVHSVEDLLHVAIALDSPEIQVESDTHRRMGARA